MIDWCKYHFEYVVVVLLMVLIVVYDYVDYLLDGRLVEFFGRMV